MAWTGTVVALLACQQSTVIPPPSGSQAEPTPHYLALPTPTSASFCSGDGARHWASSPPTTAKMASSAAGWAYGPMRTTDGGSHWSAAAPPSIPNRTPIDNEYFLDSTHAWVAETVRSAAACVSTVVPFRTADGGRTWQQAPPIPVRLADPGDYIWASPSDQDGNWFSFIDPDNGWLLVATGPAEPARSGGSPGFGRSWRAGDLYRTHDGGLTWVHVSTNPGSHPGCDLATGISFSSSSTGWIVSDCGLLTTRDGGVTWTIKAVPVTPIAAPSFSDPIHGVLLGVQGLLTTSDGGITWIKRPSPTAAVVDVVDFVSADDGWAVSFLGNDPMQAEFGLYQTTDGARSWTQANTGSLPHVPPLDYWRTKGLDAGAWGLDFVDATHGFWTLCGGPPGPCMGAGLYRTDDAGHSWTRVQERIDQA